MATIIGRGAVSFHVTLGMLVTAGGKPVRLYRSYPAKSRVPLIEEWKLDMLGTKAGVILASEGNIPLLVLRGHFNADAPASPLSLAYMTRLLPRRYAECTLRIARSANGRWQIVDATGHRIMVFTVESGRFGIHSVQPCPKN